MSSLHDKLAELRDNCTPSSPLSKMEVGLPHALATALVAAAQFFLNPDVTTLTSFCGCDTVTSREECGDCKQYTVESECGCHAIRKELSEALEVAP